MLVTFMLPAASQLLEISRKARRGEPSTYWRFFVGLRAWLRRLPFLSTNAAGRVNYRRAGGAERASLLENRARHLLETPKDNSLHLLEMRRERRLRPNGLRHPDHTVLTLCSAVLK